METLPPATRSDFIRDLSAAQAAVRGGHISSTRTAALYTQWMSHCSDLQIYHRLRTPGLPHIEILQVYGHRVRNGHYSKKCNIRADSVATAWRAIAEVHLLEGLPDPRKPLGSASSNLDKRLFRMLRHYSFQDPPSSREKAVPLGLVMSLAAGIDDLAKAACTADLIIIAL